MFSLLSYEEHINENKSSGLFSFNEMLEFINKIKPLISDEGKVKISLQVDELSSKSFTTFSNIDKEFSKIYKEIKDENPKFYIERFGFITRKLAQKVKKIHKKYAELKSLLDVTKSNPNSLTGFSIDFVTDDSSNFASRMSNDKNLD